MRSGKDPRRPAPRRVPGQSGGGARARGGREAEQDARGGGARGAETSRASCAAEPSSLPPRQPFKEVRGAPVP